MAEGQDKDLDESLKEIHDLVRRLSWDVSAQTTPRRGSVGLLDQWDYTADIGSKTPAQIEYEQEQQLQRQKLFESRLEEAAHNSRRLGLAPEFSGLKTQEHRANLKEPDTSKIEENMTAPPFDLGAIGLPRITPRTFDGTGDVLEFVEHYEDCAGLLNWTDELKQKYLRHFLENAARQWYNLFAQNPQDVGLTWKT